MTMQEGIVYDIETPLGDWVTDYEWLGIVYPHDLRYSNSLITPIAYYDNDEWCVLSEAACLEHFPENGKVFYPHNSSSLDVNRLYQFYPGTNQKPPSQGIVSYSHYISGVPASPPLDQVLNWMNAIPTILDLPAFLGQGIPTASCFSRIVYIRYGEHLYGPIYLETDGNLLKAREYLSATHSGGTPLFLQKYLFSKQIIIELAGQSFIDSRSVVSPLGKIDCSLSQVTVKATLNAYKNVKDRAKSVQLVDKVIKELASWHSLTNPEAPLIESCTLERAQHIVTSQMKMIDDLQNMLNDLPDDHPLLLAAHDHVLQQRKSEVEQEVQAYRDSIMQDLQQRKDAMEQDAAGASADAQRRLQLLQSEADAVEQKRVVAQSELDTILQKTKQATADIKKMQEELKVVEKHIEERLGQLRQDPLRVLADMHITSALQRAFVASFAQDHAVVSIVEQSTVQKTQVDAPSVVDQPSMPGQSRIAVPQPQFFMGSSSTNLPSSDVLSTAKPAARQVRVSGQSAKINAASLLAGLIPAPHGPAAASVLRAVAQAIADNRFWPIPVPLTALAPLDLLGNIASEARQFIPAGDLADIILEAQSHPQQLGIVLLEGVDRVPFLPVIAPFIQQYRAVRQQKQQATNLSISPLRLFHPRALANDDPYQPLASFCWPANLLLAVTLDQASGNFILPEVYEAWFTHTAVREAKENSPEKPVHQQLSADDWHALEKENFQHAREFSGTELPDSKSWQKLKSWQKIFVTAAIEMKLPRISLPAVMEQLWPGANNDEDEQ